MGRPQRLAVADLADRHAEEDLRVVGRSRQPGLLDVELVVERQRPGGVRLSDHRIEGDVVDRHVGRPAGGRGAHPLQAGIDLEDPPEIVRQLRRGSRGRDNAGLPGHPQRPGAHGANASDPATDCGPRSGHRGARSLLGKYWTAMGL